MVANEFLQQTVFGQWLFNQFHADSRMHRQVIPGGHAHQVRVDTRRHVGMWPHEGDQRFRAALQIPPMRVGFGDVAEQAPRLLFVKQVQRQMGDKWKPVVVIGDE